ncbi:MAG: hypothetical protein M3214_05225 [Actinomycetota bacterium]|nr:hypothetical protein [Actinomycetota bacterium]
MGGVVGVRGDDQVSAASLDRDRVAKLTRQDRSSPQRLRARWAQQAEAGIVNCARCGHAIAPGESWDLGHSDLDRSSYTGPEHRACNRATASRQIGRRIYSRVW